MMFNESPTTPPKWPTQTSTLYQISSGSWTSTSISPKLILQEKKQELVVDLHEYLDLFRDRPTKPDVQQFSRMSDCVHNQLEAKKTPKPHIATSKSFTDLSRELQRKEHQRSDSILYTYIPLSINVYYDAWWRKASQKPHINIISYIFISYCFSHTSHNSQWPKLKQPSHFLISPSTFPQTKQRKNPSRWTNLGSPYEKEVSARSQHHILRA